jgi:hypothetical protein
MELLGFLGLCVFALVITVWVGKSADGLARHGITLTRVLLVLGLLALVLL